jgi:hypothetical protein
MCYVCYALFLPFFCHLNKTKGKKKKSKGERKEWKKYTDHVSNIHIIINLRFNNSVYPPPFFFLQTCVYKQLLSYSVAYFHYPLSFFSFFINNIVT